MGTESGANEVRNLSQMEDGILCGWESESGSDEAQNLAQAEDGTLPRSDEEPGPDGGRNLGQIGNEICAKLGSNSVGSKTYFWIGAVGA